MLAWKILHGKCCLPFNIMQCSWICAHHSGFIDYHVGRREPFSLFFTTFCVEMSEMVGGVFSFLVRCKVFLIVVKIQNEHTLHYIQKLFDLQEGNLDLEKQLWYESSFKHVHACVYNYYRVNKGVRPHSHWFYPLNFKVYGQSWWNSLNEFTFICNRCLLTKCMQSIQHCMTCDIH